MKHFTKILLVMIVVLMLFLAVPLAGAQDGDNIIQTLQADGRFTTMLAAIDAAGLTDDLSSGEWTLFAPTDAAFAKINLDASNVATGYTATDLYNGVLYHAMEGLFASEEAFASEGNITTANGWLAGIKNFDGFLYVNDDSKVIEADDLTSSGYIHVVDGVILPPWPRTDSWAPLPTTAGNGVEYVLEPKTLANARGYRYCELVWSYPGDHGADIRSTSPLHECDLDWWNNLDLEATAAQFGAVSVTKNGPEWWSSDVVRVRAGAPESVQGFDMNFGAVLPPGTLGTPYYQIFNTAKTQYLLWEAGKPAYQLVDPDGHVYILQGMKLSPDQLATLGSQLTEMPAGWSYQVVNLTEDLAMDLTPANPIPSVQDQFDQIYIRIPGT